jgi:hypothetical protein
VRAEFPNVKVSGNFAMFQGQHGLDQPSYSCRRFEVSDIRFYRADDKGTVGRAALPIHRLQRAYLDRVAKRSAGTVRLNITHLFGSNICVLKCASKNRLLSVAAGNSQAAACAVVIDGRAHDEGVDLVSVTHGV